MRTARFGFFTLYLVVAISGMSQGLTLPLLSVLLDRIGVSAVANGFNAVALYLGILLVSPVMELVLRKVGFRTTILLGLVLVTVSTALLPALHGLTIWFALRLLLGVGDMALNYASQMWVTARSSTEQRGRNLSIYGFANGVGFCIGPLGMLLLPLGIWAPFLAIMVFYATAFFMLSFLKNEYPEAAEAEHSGKQRYGDVVRLGWLALLPSLLFGYMESAMNINFPLYAMHIGISLHWVSIILPAFMVGSLILQMPLGCWSDRIGRKQVMMLCSAIGAAAFLLLPFALDRVALLMALLGIAGACVGSFYSLGLAFAADVLPIGLISTAGAICSINFSVANLIAPSVNGYLLQTDAPGTMFFLLGGVLALFSSAGFLFRPKQAACKVSTNL